MQRRVYPGAGRWDERRLRGRVAELPFLRISTIRCTLSLGLKARDVKAWAGASLASGGPGYRHREISSPVKGETKPAATIQNFANPHRSMRVALTGLRIYRRNPPGPPLARLAPAQALPFVAFSPKASPKTSPLNCRIHRKVW